MKELTIREGREALSHLDEILEREGEVTLTRHGRPVARLVAIAPRRPIPSHRRLRESLPKMRRGSERLVRADRDER